jgi:hypothetical protein
VGQALVGHCPDWTQFVGKALCQVHPVLEQPLPLGVVLAVLPVPQVQGTSARGVGKTVWFELEATTPQPSLACRAQALTVYLRLSKKPPPRRVSVTGATAHLGALLEAPSWCGGLPLPSEPPEHPPPHVLRQPFRQEPNQPVRESRFRPWMTAHRRASLSIGRRLSHTRNRPASGRAPRSRGPEQGRRTQERVTRPTLPPIPFHFGPLHPPHA